jgi:heme exporter protein B
MSARVLSEPGWALSAWIILRKDLLLEWRTRARANALIFFGFCTLLLFSFAVGPDTRLLQKNAAGYLWLALLFSSVLALGESFRVEAENQALDGLRLAPADSRSVFLGKAIGTTLVTFTLSWALVPVMVALYDVKLALGPGPLALVLLLGCAAISAPGTLHAAISSHARARDILLPLLLFPLIVPALLAAVKATALVLEGDPMGQLGSWLGLLAGFNVTFWGAGFVLFPKVVEP